MHVLQEAKHAAELWTSLFIEKKTLIIVHEPKVVSMAMWNGPLRCSCLSGASCLALPHHDAVRPSLGILVIHYYNYVINNTIISNFFFWWFWRKKQAVWTCVIVSHTQSCHLMFIERAKRTGIPTKLAHFFHSWQRFPVTPSQSPRPPIKTQHQRVIVVITTGDTGTIFWTSACEADGRSKSYNDSSVLTNGAIFERNITYICTYSWQCALTNSNTISIVSDLVYRRSL